MQDIAIASLKSKLSHYETAYNTLVGYREGKIPLPSSYWDRDEIIDMQKKTVDGLFEDINGMAYGLERINSLPSDLSEKIAKYKENA